MRALLLKQVKKPLVLEEISQPSPGPDEVLVKVFACALCRTDMHIIDGELLTKLPIIPGHQIVGQIESIGKNVRNFSVGDSVGIAWLAHTCAACSYCHNHQENLCDHALFTGYNMQGGWAQYTIAHHQFIYPLPSLDPHLAPFLCAGMIGYRCLKKCGPAKKIGFYGFGNAAHILIQTAISMGKEIYAFTRPGDLSSQKSALSLHAAWSGDSDRSPPTLLDAAIIFAPVGHLIPTALAHLRKGGIVVCAGIHMSAIPSMAYNLLWGERTITSVANLTRQDGHEFLKMIPHLKTQITIYPLHQANQAIDDFRSGALKNSAVFIP